jgi:hypothetical protein
MQRDDALREYEILRALVGFRQNHATSNEA